MSLGVARELPLGARFAAACGDRGHALLAVAASVVSAGLIWAASPPIGIGWLSPFALAPALAAAFGLDGRAGRAAVPLACALYLELLLVPAFPFGITEGQWGDPALPILVGDSPVLALALVAVPLAGLLLYAIRFPLLAPLHRLPGGAVGGIVVTAATWTAFEFVRVRTDPSAYWGPLFLVAPDGPGALLAQLGGPWLVTAAIVAANATLALLLVGGQIAAIRLAAAAAVVVGLLAAPPLAAPSELAPIRVAAVQPGYDTAQYELEVLRSFRAGVRDYERTSLDLVADLAPLTRSAAAQGAELVVWPEATAWADPRSTPSVRAALGRLAREAGVTIVVPYFLEPAARGASLAVLPDGSLTTPQPKLRPMWYLGEDGVEERGAFPFDTPSGTIGALLGVDAQGLAPARAHVAAGADILISATHDWAQLVPQQLAFARLQAIALGVPLVRADWRYGSAVIDASGGVVATAGPSLGRAVVTGDVERRRGRTPYVVVGDALGLAALGVAALAAALVRIPPLLRRRASAGSAPPEPGDSA